MSSSEKDTTSSSINSALSDIKVLDLATFIAGPYCATFLAEFGADVVKVELPGSGDPLRKFGTMTDCGDSLVWLSEGRNKRSIELDLRSEEGSATLKKLVASADVLCENFQVGTLEKWGLFKNGENPVARSNVCPAGLAPAEPVFHAFSYVVPASDGVPKGFITAGGAEAPRRPRKLLQADGPLWRNDAGRDPGKSPICPACHGDQNGCPWRQLERRDHHAFLFHS